VIHQGKVLQDIIDLLVTRVNGEFVQLNKSATHMVDSAMECGVEHAANQLFIVKLKQEFLACFHLLTKENTITNVLKKIVKNFGALQLQCLRVNGELVKKVAHLVFPFANAIPQGRVLKVIINSHVIMV